MVVILVTAYLFVSPFLRQSSTEKHYSREQDEEVSHLNLTKWSKSKKKKEKKKTPNWIFWHGLLNPHIRTETVSVKRYLLSNAESVGKRQDFGVGKCL